MKKLILKTALITLGTTIILLIAVFGLMSLCAPAVMMRLTASLGLDGISGDYAYQEYERSGKIEYLSRSFIVAATTKNDRNAEKRFEMLYTHDEFDSFCAEQNGITIIEGKTSSYRSYICGLAAQVKYRTAETEEEKAETCRFTIEETIKESGVKFPVGNPVVILATTAASNHDGAFCGILYDAVYDSEFNDAAGILNADERNDFQYVMKILMTEKAGNKA